MSNPVYRMIGSAADDTTGGNHTAPTTSTVEEFICLFTHDLRQKKKRWKDGRLKYHTFNRRVMVHDLQGNFIGDTHWRPEHDLDEGEELQLDQGSAIVQVLDRSGTQVQDLTELLDKRAREVAKRRAIAEAQQNQRPPSSNSSYRDQAVSPATTATPRSGGGGGGGGSSGGVHFQLLQRPLSAIVPNAGRIGRAAVPQMSPHEQRRLNIMSSGGGNIRIPGSSVARKSEDADGEDTPRPAMRAKRSVSPPSKSGHARSLFGTALTLSATPVSSQTARRQILRESTNEQPQQLQQPIDEDLGKGARDVRMEREMRGAAPDQERLSAPEQYIRTNEERDTAEYEVAPRSRPNKSARKSALASDSTPAATTVDEARMNSHHRGLPGKVAGLQRQSDRGPKSSGGQLPSAGVTARREDTASCSDAHHGGQETTSHITPTIKGLAQPKSNIPIGSSEPCTAERSNTHHASPTTAPELTGLSVSVEGTKATDKPPEKRAKLRIRSTKKRGLLIVAEKAAPAPRKQEASEIKRPCVRIRDASLSVTDMSDVEVTVPGSPWSDHSPERTTSKKATALPPPSLYLYRLGDEMELVTSDSNESVIPSSPAPQSRHKANHTPQPQAVGGQSGKRKLRRASRPLSRSGDSRSPYRYSSAIRKSNSASDSKSDSGSDRESDSGSELRKSVRDPLRSTRQNAGQSNKARPICLDDDSDSDDGTHMPIVVPAATKPLSRATKSRAKAGTGSPKGPHVKRLQRKSIKSKEIFGFKPPDSNSLVPNAFAAATARAGLASAQYSSSPAAAPAQQSAAGSVKDMSQAPRNNGHITEQCHQKAPDHPPLGQMREGPAVSVYGNVTDMIKSNITEAVAAGVTAAPKRINPATRGRKAAQKGDAAGREPRTLVPLEAAAPTRQQQATSTSHQGNAPAGLRSKSANAALPGFSTANGGAWSKHARDLLGMERPGGARKASG